MNRKLRPRLLPELVAPALRQHAGGGVRQAYVRRRRQEVRDRDIDATLFLADRMLVMSPCPGRFIADLLLKFARPSQTGLLTSPDFVHLKRHCLELLCHEEGHQLPRWTPLGLLPPTHSPLRIAL